MKEMEEELSENKGMESSVSGSWEVQKPNIQLFLRVWGTSRTTQFIYIVSYLNFTNISLNRYLHFLRFSTSFPFL